MDNSKFPVICIAQVLRGAGGGGFSLIWVIYVGMCVPTGYGFSAILVINRVSILADFGHFGYI